MDPKILTILRMSGLERVADLIESDGLTAEGVSVHYLLGKGITAEDAVKAVTIIEMTRQPGAPAGEAPAGRSPEASTTPASPPTGSKPPQSVGVTLMGVFCWLLTLPAIAMLCGGESQFTCSIPTVFAVILLSILNLRKAETQGLKIFVGLPIPVSGLIYISSAIASIGSASSYKENETALGFLSGTIFWGGISLLVLKHSAVKEKLSRVTAPIRTAMAKARDRFAAIDRNRRWAIYALSSAGMLAGLVQIFVPHAATAQCGRTPASIEAGETYEFQCVAIDQFGDQMGSEPMHCSSGDESILTASAKRKNDSDGSWCSINSVYVGTTSLSIWSSRWFGRSEIQSFLIEVTPRANFTVLYSSSSAECSTFGDACITATCTVTNAEVIGPPVTGHVRIVVGNTLARGEDLTLSPGARQTITINFPEYELGMNNDETCSIEHSPLAKYIEDKVTTDQIAANEKRDAEGRELAKSILGGLMGGSSSKPSATCTWECNKNSCDRYFLSNNYGTKVNDDCDWWAPNGWVCINGPCQ